LSRFDFGTWELEPKQTGAQASSLALSAQRETESSNRDGCAPVAHDNSSHFNDIFPKLVLPFEARWRDDHEKTATNRTTSHLL